MSKQPFYPLRDEKTAKRDAKLRLICFPFAGGGAAAFSGWDRLLPPEIEAVAVELPGRATRFCEPAIKSWQVLRPALDAGLLGLFDRPTALFGYSLGAKLAFELVRLLRARGVPEPLCFFTAASPAPQHVRTAPPRHLLSQPAFLDELRRLGGTPQVLFDEPALLELLLPTLRADFQLADLYEYTPAAPLSCPLVCFYGTDDPSVPIDAALAWREHTTRRFRAEPVAAGHFFIESARPRLLSVVVEELQRALGVGPGERRS